MSALVNHLPTKCITSINPWPCLNKAEARLQIDFTTIFSLMRSQNSSQDREHAGGRLEYLDIVGGGNAGALLLDFVAMYL